MSTKTRLAVAADAATITAFNAAMALETEHKTLDPLRLRAGVEALLADPRKGVYFVAEADGAVVGQMMITLEWSDWRNGTFWWIQSVYVRPENRGQSVYRRLHEFVEAEARRDPSVCGLRLYVEQDNHRAQRTYAALGMRRTGYQVYESEFGACGD